MKVKIKGLVFVGFAAAILSANAMAAGENTVTSKSYVDSKYIAGTGITVTENEQGKKVISTTADLTAYTAGTGLNLDDHEFSNTGVTSVSATAQNGTDGTIMVSTGGAEAVEVAVKNVEVQSNKVQTIDATLTAEEKAANYPSQAAVENLVGAAYTGENGIDVNATTHVITNTGVRGVVASETNDAEGTIRLNVNGTPTAYPVKNVEVTGNKVTSLSSSSTDTQYPSAKAVYDMFGGNTIPKKSTVCNTNPCALVAESDGLHWYTMASATHNGGVPGDYCTTETAATVCGTGYSCVSNACTANN